MRPLRTRRKPNSSLSAAFEQPLPSVFFKRLTPVGRKLQNLCADKGDDYLAVRELLREWGSMAHIPPRGRDDSGGKPIPGHRARRRGVERTHSWSSRFRRLLIRRENKLENYGTLLCFACAWVTFRAASILG